MLIGLRLALTERRIAQVRIDRARRCGETRGVSPIPDPLPLFHGTLKPAAEEALSTGFKIVPVGDRMQALADRYGVDYAALAAEVGPFVWQRDRDDRSIYFTTNPRNAASFARRGSEIEYFGRQAIWRLQNSRDGTNDWLWSRLAVEWAKAEVARGEKPVIVRAEVPQAVLPPEKIEGLSRMLEYGPSGQTGYLGEDFLLSPEVASRYAVRLEEVDPCTCWSDGRICDVCRDSERVRGGWDGTYV
jgi:hypothetical protein